MSERFDLSPFNPGFHAAAELIGRRWNCAILWALCHGLNRFSELHAAVPGLSPRLLSVRLKELEAAGVLRRVVMPGTPVSISYHLTPRGEALREVFVALDAWALTWLHDDSPPPRSTVS
ncbi:hypothetical protein DAETH_36590 (plasmid) [Deinococcus aetherius]|uniref:HTH hxlR-type domain-containing protein n=1 Tax=Deinococcus aetherius TaxID=200252 RepID=A0ABN6RK28_9DEIO|nr:helix-turn-helix domain-containing protein [Deinococcus aetherius]BDP43690.1 hypothetical protein DAETH_36590 [Deinococcus aetherius]